MPGAVPRVEEVDEVELAEPRSVLVASGSGAGEADDLAVDERGEHLELGTLDGPVRPELGHAARGDLLERGLADQVVVGLVPARRVHPAEGLGVDVPYRTDDDVGLQFGFHGQTLRSHRREAKSTGICLWTAGWRIDRMPRPALSICHNRFAGTVDGGYHRVS